MAYKTLEQLIQQTIIELRLESGPSVQQYAEDVIARKLQRMFNALFMQYWWPEYTVNGEVMPLDGTTGQVTTDLTAKIKRIEDVRFIFYESEKKPLARAPDVFNPTTSFRRYWQPIAGNKIFRILPITTTGNVTVAYRTKPDDFVAADEIKMDEDLLVSAVVFDYLVEDNENEKAIEKWAKIYEKREAQIREVMNAGPLPYGNATYNPLTDWMTYP